jgi:SAM-dependent methyltransferase
MTEFVCKICQGSLTPRHTIQNVNYYFCPSCQLLQNFYWETATNPAQEQIITNDDRRTKLWPAGERDYMYQIGWNHLERLAWPLAWHYHRLHRLLNNFPPYQSFVRQIIKRKIHRLLDFGCGHGTSVLEILSRDNFDSLGLDPFSPTRSPHIITRSLADADFPDNSFDAIFSIETAEHISNILPTFRELHRILKPGKNLLIQTHRLEHPGYQSQQEKWYYLQDPHTHVSVYSQPAFKEIARRAGFSSVAFHGPRLALFTK